MAWSDLTVEEKLVYALIAVVIAVPSLLATVLEWLL